ncbi:hypothetical protein H2200_010682 [Cladophialophora chaetospira]|uniref:Uncharacterized protein n=1 Tax=Cladophialophora chaetospira TaxID=386627 RepID=A0AA38X0K3_9EURO|nr:hypothetical protein H2200_010682 [Cladophialophora chaetospira]
MRVDLLSLDSTIVFDACAAVPLLSTYLASLVITYSIAQLPKINSSALPTSHMPPFSRPFAFRIKQARYVRGSSTEADTRCGPEFLWRPSDSGSFLPENESNWWIWDPGWHQPYHGLQRLRPRNDYEVSAYRPYKSCTIIWAPERQHYLHIPIDRTTTDQEDHVWRRLSFGYDEHRPHIAVIGHSRESEWLKDPGPEKWFPKLLPIAYQAQEYSTSFCGLAGELSILVGLTALSTTPEESLRALDQSFRPDPRSTLFQPHDCAESPKREKRIIVVEIAHDPGMISADQLADWEQGRYGAIFN